MFYTGFSFFSTSWYVHALGAIVTIKPITIKQLSDLPLTLSSSSHMVMPITPIFFTIVVTNSAAVMDDTTAHHVHFQPSLIDVKATP